MQGTKVTRPAIVFSRVSLRERAALDQLAAQQKCNRSEVLRRLLRKAAIQCEIWPARVEESVGGQK